MKRLQEFIMMIFIIDLGYRMDSSSLKWLTRFAAACWAVQTIAYLEEQKSLFSFLNHLLSFIEEFDYASLDF